MKMKNKLSCLTTFMLGLGIVCATAGPVNYQEISVVNKSSHRLTIRVSTGLITEFKEYTVAKGQTVEIKAKLYKSIPEGANFDIRLTDFSGGEERMANIFQRELSFFIDRPQELKFNVKPESITIKTMAKATGSSVNMIFEDKDTKVPDDASSKPHFPKPDYIKNLI